MMSRCILMAIVMCVCFPVPHCAAQVREQKQSVPAPLRKWLKPQVWIKDTSGPVLELGAPGDFDDTHLFAPAVTRNEDRFTMWYCGSRGTVAERVFNLGFASSPDGKRFQKSVSNPAFSFGDGKHSVLTVSILRDTAGSITRFKGKAVMWFSSTHFADGTGRHALYRSQSDDGMRWETPSEPLLENVYAPSVILDGGHLRMWYVDVGSPSWDIKTAISENGVDWKVHPEPALKVGQGWEKQRLFYPHVIKADGVYLMWYGSYWAARRNTTALGFAASVDGLTWIRHDANPVMMPDPKRPWESNYNTSQSVIRLRDGSFRMWYATRKKPPFVNKYFAVGTAVWNPE